MARRGRGPGLLRRLVRGALLALVALVLVFAGLVLAGTAVPPVSTLMLARLLAGQSYAREDVPLGRVAPVAVAAVLASEDAQFCRHDGVDWGALREVLDDADEDGPSRGASTITMQVAKNLFLWPWRSALRKGMEIGVALVLDRAWSKRRVLEVYLNVAEWGEGVFGVEAAARRYFGKGAADLDAREAALLATALPNPRLRNPARPGPAQRRLAALVMARARGMGPYLDCLPAPARGGGDAED